MIELAWWQGAVISMFFSFVGVLLGAFGERASWVLRAWKPGSHHAHCVEGKFYYVIPEHYFHENYVMRSHFPMNKEQLGEGKTP